MGEPFAFPFYYIRKSDSVIFDYIIHKLTEENPPEVNRDKCVNLCGETEMCSICKDVCPEQAVLVKDKVISFNGELCTNCGICKAKCPTQAIRVKGTGEEDLLNSASEKKNLLFSCSLEKALGNINISCLNAMHPELISALFILLKEKKFYFNLSKCTKCEFGYEDSLFRVSLEKALSFVNELGIYPDYEILDEEKDFSDLVDEEISRRNLFKLVKKESSNVVFKTINTIIDDDDDQFSVRKILLKSLKSLELKDEMNYTDIFWEHWNVSADCDGCGKCESICPGKAWNIIKTDNNIKLSHKLSNCYKCGLCESICPKNAIAKGKIEDIGLFEIKLKRDINLKTCKKCNKKFIPRSEDNDECDICKKKELLRKKISASI